MSINLSCTSGTLTNSPQLAREGAPAVFNITGAAQGATFTATEPSVPSGYTRDHTDCQSGDPLNGSCTIFNTLDVISEEVIFEYDFENGDAEGWSLSGNVAIDGVLAIGQYSLRHSKGTSSERGIVTSGYVDVSVTMHLAATSLTRSDSCSAEVSTNGGTSWTPVIEVNSSNDTGNFLSATASPAGADDNSNVRLRFRYAGNGKGGYCYGDEVSVSGTPIGN